MTERLHQIGKDGAPAAEDEPSTQGAVAEPVHEEPVAPGTSGMINVRNLSIKCGHCGMYQTLMKFTRNAEGWSVYIYECENQVCDPERSRTLLEFPHDLDEFAHRDPGWRGGAIHGGAE